jgi:DNA-binding NtrC family response regulator
MIANILVVDDQESIRHFIQKALEDEGYEVASAATGGDAIRMIETDLPDLVLLDLRLPDTHGLDVLKRAKEVADELTVIIMTAFGDVESAVRAMKMGAFDYVTKPIHLEQLSLLVEKGLESQKLWRELQHHRRQQKQMFSKDFVRGVSRRILDVYSVAERVAESDTTSVLIEGESGTGKQLVASLIHESSSRRDKPFLEINCAAIPKTLLESELFGHEKGAFTDARTQKQGLLELANGGTVFLDEVGEMSLNIQVKLLKVLEKMTFRRVGGTKDITVSVRIISATNQDLEAMVRQGTFREDLYYRLKVVPIHMPALRERPEDILLVAKHFMLKFSKDFNKRFCRISPAAERMLQAYHWPGNIRELKNLLERTILLESGDTIEPRHIQAALSPREERAASRLHQLDEILNHTLVPEGGIPFEAILEEIERALIMKASELAAWNQSKTAEILNLKRDKLRYRMKIYGIRGREGDEDRPGELASAA